VARADSPCTGPGARCGEIEPWRSTPVTSRSATASARATATRVSTACRAAGPTSWRWVSRSRARPQARTHRR
jgi:hypothetical protein